ncbi:MAG: radical SAM protein [Nanoarchaeota archaeon]|nr:radical SAM protein [Nanoarchaeota archaeon]
MPKDEKPYFSLEPLELSYVKAVLKNKGFNSEVIDEKLQKLSIKHIAEKIKFQEDFILGIRFSDFSLKKLEKFLSMLKNAKGHICALGSFATRAPKLLLEKFSRIDSIIIGDPEMTFFYLVRALINNHDWHSIKSLAFRMRENIKINLLRQCRNNLDLLPFPDRTFISLVKNKYPISIQGSRGCPWAKCSFCAEAAFIRKSKCPVWWGRNPANIVKEMKFLNKKYGVNNFSFVDECFFGKKDFIERGTKLAELIVKEKLNITYSLDARLEHIDDKMLKKMKKSGLKTLYLGIEGYDKTYLKKLNKGISIQQIDLALQICSDLNIDVIIGFIPFSYDIDFKTLKDNLLFLTKLNFFQKGLYTNILVPMQGTVFFNDLVQKGIWKLGLENQSLLWKDKRVSDLYSVISWFEKRVFFHCKQKIKKEKSTVMKKLYDDFVLASLDFFAKEKNKQQIKKFIDFWENKIREFTLFSAEFHQLF